MLRQRSLAGLTFVAVVVVAALVFLQRAPEPGSIESGPLFPEMLDRVNEVSSIRIATASEEFTIERGEAGWTVPSRSGYPADFDAVRDTLLGFSGMQRVEPKTRTASLYQKLGLDEITTAGSRATEVRLLDPDGAVLATVIMGDVGSGPAPSGQTQYYVRLPDDPQAWLVNAELSLLKNPADWLDKQVLELPQERIRGVTVTAPDSGAVAVYRDGPDTADFTLRAIPAGKQIKYQFAVNDVANSFASLSLEDVQPADAVDFAGATRVVMDTFDGLRVNADIVQQDETKLVRLWSGEGESVASPAPIADNATGADAGHGAEAVAAEVAQLNERWSGWAYQLSRFEIDNITRPMSDLVEDVPAGDSADNATGATGQ